MQLPKRRLQRLSDYDYSQNGYYFITICTKGRKELFGEIIGSEVILNKYGEIAEINIVNLNSRYDNVKIDNYIIMPNHIHLLIIIENEISVDLIMKEKYAERINPFPTVDIPNIVGKLKAGITRDVGNRLIRSDNVGMWQKSYHDHIIRDEKSYQKIYEYIETNPVQWDLDCHNPKSEKFKV
jgi:REP element-mobilizing transposase RayT